MGRIFDIFKNLRLVWRLFWDHRVPLFLKFAIPLSLGYLALPFDLLRDFGGLPVIGRIDDFIILALASIIFVRLAPPAVVREHRQAIWGKRFKESDSITEGEYEILDGKDGKDGKDSKDTKSG